MKNFSYSRYWNQRLPLCGHLGNWPTRAVQIAGLALVGLLISCSNLGTCLPGQVDSTFGDGGKVLVDVGVESVAYDLKLLDDGKWLLVGGRKGKVVLARLLASGGLDTSFGTGGKVITALSIEGYGAQVRTLGDGKILVTGPLQGTEDNDLTLLRYTANGVLDSSFGTEGRVSTDLGGLLDLAYALEVQPDGKILVAGNTNPNDRFAFALVRYNPDGGLDPSFGTGGKVITPVDQAGTGYSGDLLLLPNGKILVAGNSDVQANLTLVRHNSDGSLDTSFGLGGKVYRSVQPTGVYPTVTLLEQPDGKFLVGGAMGGASTNFALFRFNPDGSPDQGFGLQGLAQHNVEAFDYIGAMHLNSDGSILSIGGSGIQGILLRWKADGSLDTSFAEQGVAKLSLGPKPFTFLYSSRVLGDKVMVAGVNGNLDAGGEMVLARVCLK